MKEALDRFHPIFRPGAGNRTLLLLHGTGGNETSLLRFAEALDPAANVLSIRGQVSENGYPRFFRRLAEGVFDLEDLKFRAGELAEFIALATEEWGIDPARLVAFGYSNGANIASATMMLHPHAIRHAALIRPMWPTDPESPPDLAGHSALLHVGAFDPMSPPGSPEKLQDRLTEYGANVVYRRLDAGHELTQDDLQLAGEWIETL
jgi:phospholipase/carboxylesterase